MKIFEGDGADRAGVIGLIRQGFARVGLEADQPDRDWVSSDQGFLIGQSGCDRSDQGRLRPRQNGIALRRKNEYALLYQNILQKKVFRGDPKTNWMTKSASKPCVQKRSVGVCKNGPPMLRNIGGPFLHARTLRGQKWLNALFGSSQGIKYGGGATTLSHFSAKPYFLRGGPFLHL